MRNSNNKRNKENQSSTKQRIIATAMVIALALTSLFAQGSKESNQQSVSYTFGGSSTVAPIIESAIPAYQANHQSEKITYETLGSSVGIKGLSDGTLTLAGSSRELKESELNAGLVPTVIALDGLSVVVNADVKIGNLSSAQLASLFSGEITNWKDVGGEDKAVVLVVRDETSGTYGSFKEIILDKQKKTPTKNAIVAKENGELATKVASTPGAIGYCGMAFGETVVESGGMVLSVDGIDPTTENVIRGSYPISRNLYVVTKGQPSGTEKAFIDFLLSDKGQQIVQESGFIPLR